METFFLSSVINFLVFRFCRIYFDIHGLSTLEAIQVFEALLIFSSSMLFKYHIFSYQNQQLFLTSQFENLIFNYR